MNTSVVCLNTKLYRCSENYTIKIYVSMWFEKREDSTPLYMNQVV
jgi:hypothetical protein